MNPHVTLRRLGPASNFGSVSRAIDTRRLEFCRLDGIDDNLDLWSFDSLETASCLVREP